MNYKQIEEHILNIPKFRKEGSIEQARKFYEFLGKPESSVSVIHVAGTNGKGSTCAYMNSVLTEAGYKVGMFTSPHLVSVRERMRINDCLISEQEFVKVYQQLDKKLDSYNTALDEEGDFYNTALSEEEHAYNTSKSEEINARDAIKKYIPTFYEFLFFMAMLYFKEKKTEVIILETGLGGRLDATNMIDAPKVAVITEIGKDHMEYLGNTYELIAEEKAGIIKKGSYVIYSGNRQETATIIERKSKDIGVLCKCVEKLGKQDYRFVDKKIDFSFRSRYYGYIPIKLNTCAIYQVENARLALNALEGLELSISKEAMQKGMEKCRWEGRMEEILPGIFLDGAHNEDGIEAFLSTVQMDGCRGKKWLLFSAVADKEYQIMGNKLLRSGEFSHVYAAPLNNVRGISKEELKAIFRDGGVKVENICENKSDDLGLRNISKDCNLDNQTEALQVRILDSACEGLQEIISLKEENDFVYVVGSLYLVGEIKEYYENR